MNKLYGLISKNNINNFNYEKNIFENQKKISSFNYLLLTNNNEPFIKYDCQTKYIIIYNGMLLNKDELKCKLRTLGYQFKTDLDEEIIIDAYIYYKENCFKYFKGSYSIAIYGDNKIIIARDKFGVKPMFYSINDNYFIFSNEIKNLLKSKLVEPIVDETGIKELFSLGPSFTPSLTPYKDIKMVKPGEYIIYEDNNISKKIYYKLPIYLYNKSQESTIKELKELLEISVNKLINNKENYSSLLSGGIDSSIVSLFANKRKKFDTYFLEYNNNNIYFEQNDYQKSLDKDYADIMADKLKTNHKIITIYEEDLFNSLIDSMKARDLPGMGDIDSSLFILFKNINNSFVLTGECSDEIFGGYPWYYNDTNNLILPWIRDIKIRQDLLKDNYQYLDLSKHLNYSYNELLKDYEEAVFDNLKEKKWRKLTYLNIYGFMQQLLYRQEMLSSTNNITALSPFIDNDLVEFAYNLPCNYKYNKTEKYILKEAFKNSLPSEITSRVKNPYPKTFSPIYEKMVCNKIKEYLDNPLSSINKFFKKEKILEYINDKDSKIPYYGQLMTNTQFLSYLIQFEEWVKIYNVKFEI